MGSTPEIPLAERSDIHKSCKSLETLLNVFNDYCEAAGVVAMLQKKLAKALRETAGLKVTNEVAANAMNTSASIFEALSDIDSKFTKVMDKEYDGVSNEVKKWFKKLAKEEKAHDDRITSANAKIKQAGQVYEKKSKKGARDVDEEHARYINLISSLGPEISQEKYNHASNITQRHTSTTYSVAACLSRVADAEWLRTCEGVRRCSPTIGQLGEWRSLCEGGWTGPIPPDLPEPEDILQSLPEPESIQRTDVDEYPVSATVRLNDLKEGPGQSELPSGGHATPPVYERDQTYTSQATVPKRSMPVGPQQHYSGSQSAERQSQAPSSFDPLRPLVDPNTGSVRSLSAFPAPPTHFPLPSLASRRQQSSQAPSSRTSSASHVSFPTSSQQNDSRQGLDENGAEGTDSFTQTPMPSPSSPQDQFKDTPRAIERNESSTSAGTAPPTSPVRSRELPVPGEPIPSIKPLDSPTSPSRTYPRGDYGSEEGAKPTESPKAKSIERSDTMASNGSIVAAMRNRYSHNAGTSSPPPKDIPRLPLSVNNLATRYQPTDERATSPRLRAASPQGSRPLPSIDSYTQAREAEASFREPNPTRLLKLAPVTEPVAEVAHQDDRYRQQLGELGMNEQTVRTREKELELEARERDIEIRAKQLEQERANLMNAREIYSGEQTPRGSVSPQPLRPRERRSSFQYRQRAQSQMDLVPPPSISPNASNVRSTSPHAYSSTHLVPPASASSPRTSSDDGSVSDHADFCGCERCSVSKYKTSSSPTTMNSPVSYERPAHLGPNVSEKPKSWMRRLSMPIVVGNAFLDGKRNQSTTLGGGKSGRLFDSKKNGSNTALRNAVTEDGRFGAVRRSYDASGISNRSVTSLGLKR